MAIVYTWCQKLDNGSKNVVCNVSCIVPDQYDNNRSN